MATRRFRRGQKVIVERLPDGFLDDLPRFDQKAISSIIGKPLSVVGEENGRVEIQFEDVRGDPHWLYLESQYVRAVRKRKTDRKAKTSSD